MTTTLTLPPRQENPPREEEWQENARQLDEILGITNPALEKTPFYERATTEEWIAALDLWANSHDPNGPVLLDDSREIIYED